MSRWFRHYAGMMRDDKLVRAALRSRQPIERVVWVWGAILESAAEINDGGRYDFDTAEAAYFLRADEDDIRAIEASLVDCGRVAEDRVVKWGDRQFKSDGSAERVRRHRVRQKSESNGNDERGQGEAERYCNDDVTLRNAPETETETNTEEEKKEDIVAVAPRAPDDGWPSDFREQFWQAYPRKLEKKAAIASLERVRKSGKVDWTRLIAAVRAYAATADPQFTKHPTTWLNKGCWDDELPPKTATQPRRHDEKAQSVHAAAANLVERMRAFDERPGDLRSTTGGSPLRLLSSG